MSSSASSTTNDCASNDTTSATASSAALRFGMSSSRIRKYSSTQQPSRASCSGNLSLMRYLKTRNWTPYANVDIVQVARNHPPFLRRLDYVKRLTVHDGCVNTICWNKTGEYILSGSDDCNLCITKPGDMFNSNDHYTVLNKIQTHHLGNIFCARFVPNSADKTLVSCSSDGPVIVHDINATDPSEGLFTFNCHSETIYEVEVVPDDDKVFFSCGEDKTIRLFDMRVHRSCARATTCPHPALIRNSHAVTTLQLHPFNSNLMLVGRADGLGLVYDRRKLPDVTRFTRERAHAERLAGIPSQSYQFKHPLEGVVAQFSVPEMEEKCRLTSLCYNANGTEVLASYSGDYIYLFDHDRSSNFTLIQTLPKRATSRDSSSSANEGNQNADSDSGDRHQSSRRSTSREPEAGANQALQNPARASRGSRISSIRIRGDWSDTGVNSVPLSAYSNRDNSSSADTAGSRRTPLARTSFLEQVRVTLGSHRARGNRFVPTEIVAGPIDWSHEPSERRQEQTIEEEEEGGDQANNDNEEDDDDDDNWTLIDDHDDRDESDNEDNGAMFTRYAHRTARNLLDSAASELASRGLQTGESNTQMDLDDCNSANSSDKQRPREGGASGTRAGRDGISSRSREKFKATVENLKNKYSRIASYKPRVEYQGHRNSRTSCKKAIFWGDDYVMSGSDCGRIMVWEKESAQIITGFQADERVVNCLAPNPSTYVLASSGIDYDIKLWATQALKDGPLMVSESEMKRIVDNNELMLDESRYTLSVPPHLFIRVLASLVQSSR